MNLNFEPAEMFRGTRVLRQADNLAYAYETAFKAVDADGAPNAYHPDNIGLDLLANAGYPNTNWWRDVLVPDPGHSSRAYVQPDGDYEGYFVSMTSLRKPQGDKLDPSTYVDSRNVPYVVIPTGFNHLPNVAKPGDVGFATHLGNGKTTTFIVADAGGGSDAKLGEGSIALFILLGGQEPNPRNGQGVPSGKIQYIIFSGSRRPGAGLWPRTNQDIHDQAMELLARTPGIGPGGG